MWKLCFPEGQADDGGGAQCRPDSAVKILSGSGVPVKAAVVKRDREAYDRILEQTIAIV